jgi:hypothetical protein
MFAEVFAEAIILFGFQLQFLDRVRLEKLMEIKVDLRIHVFQHEHCCVVKYLL